MKPYQDKMLLESLYAKYKSTYKVADELGVNQKTIAAWMKKFDIQTTVGTQGARKNHLNHDYFQEIDAPEKAYWFGFLMADGCVYKGSDKSSYRLQVNLKEADKEHLEAFQKSIESNYKIQTKLVNKSKACLLKINSTKLCLDLISHGLTPRKSIVCKMPKIKRELLNHFIRGYFDGDGCITSTNGKWSLKIVGGDSMLESIKDFLADHGVETVIYPINHSRAKSLETSKHQSIYEIFKVIYKDASTFLQRKYDKYHDFAIRYKLSPSGVILLK